MVVPIDYLFAVGRVGRLSTARKFGFATPADVDRVDLSMTGGITFRHHVGDLLAVGRVGRSGFVRVVVGEFGLTSPADSDRVDLCVGSLDFDVGDPLGAGRVGRAVVVPIVVRHLALGLAAGVDGVDLVVVPVVARIGDPTVFARKGSLRLL